MYISSYLVERTVRKQSASFSFLVKDNPMTIQRSLEAVTWHMLCKVCFIRYNWPHWLTKLCFKDIRMLDYLTEIYSILPQVLCDIIFLIKPLGTEASLSCFKKNHEIWHFGMAILTKWHFDTVTLKKIDLQLLKKLLARWYRCIHFILTLPLYWHIPHLWPPQVKD